VKLSIKSIKQIIKSYWQEILLFIGFISYNIYFIAATFQKYANYYMGRFDLGNMDQTVWNTIHGNIFMLTDPNGTQPISRLAVHADFILILLSPLYLIWEDPRMLLLAQTIILSIGGIFVFLISKKVLKNKTISLVFALCFFLNPAVQYTNLFDFHGVTLATTFLLGAFYFSLIKKWWLTLIFLFLAGITKEEVWAINAIFGLYLIFIHKQKILGTFTAVFSAAFFIFLFWIAIPNAAVGQHFALEFFMDFGTTPGEVMKNIILNPIHTIQILTTPDRLDYLRQLFLPLGYLSILAFPFLVFALPEIMINLLSSSPQMHQIYYQYSSTITPFIFISAIYGVRFLIKKFPEVPYWSVGIILLIFTFASAYSYGPLFFAKKPQDAWYQKTLENRDVVDSYLSKIPNNWIISASNNLGSHLSRRDVIYVAPSGIEKADYILLLYPNPNEIDKQVFKSVISNPEFSLEFNDKDFYVFKRIAR